MKTYRIIMHCSILLLMGLNIVCMAQSTDIFKRNVAATHSPKTWLNDIPFNKGAELIIEYLLTDGFDTQTDYNEFVGKIDNNFALLYVGDISSIR